jgi:cobalt-zinc-cadmium efflux system outer membrane protein
VAAARIAMNAAAERLLQAGLDLAASAKIAYADLALAEARQQLAEEAASLLQRINELTQSRLAAGDISELEARAARVDAARSRQDVERGRRDVEIARNRLRGLLGFAVDGPAFTLAAEASSSPLECGALEPLLKEALASRPDVRAAELGVESAAARLGWERSRILALTAVLDANGAGKEGFEAGPGVDVGLPLFDRNQGGRARATAELQRATAAYAAAQQRVALELREAALQYDQARESQAFWQDAIVAPLEENVTAADKAFAEGDTSYLFVLENARRLSDARVREREINADLHRARARIERASGRACGPPHRELTRGY